MATIKRKMVIKVRLADEYIQRIQSIIPDWHIISGQESSKWQPDYNQAEILVAWNLKKDSEYLQTDSNLHWIQTWAAGVNLMPLDILNQRKIKLTNSSGVHAIVLSESFFAMLLTFTSQLHIYIRNQLDKQWIPNKNMPEVYGKTIGILGVGAIGLEIAKRAKAFGMKVIGLRRSGEPLPEVDQMFDNNGLDDLLTQCDFVVSVIPFTKDTYHFMGKKQFQKMKPSALFFNVGRGQTTDTDALIQALIDKQIAGAGLDVFEQEPLPESSPLWEMENVIISPHTSGHTNHYNDRAMDIFIANLQKYLIDQEPEINLVDLDRQY